MLHLLPQPTPKPLAWPPAYVWAHGQWLALHHNDYESERPPDLACYAQVLWGGEDEEQ